MLPLLESAQLLTIKYVNFIISFSIKQNRHHLFAQICLNTQYKQAFIDTKLRPGRPHNWSPTLSAANPCRPRAHYGQTWRRPQNRKYIT